MNLSQLKRKASDLSDSPGVYLMKNLREEIIYVGKAKVLKKRVSSYFVGLDSKDPKTKALVREICDFEVILTELEEEALLLERNVIRHHSPRYNVIFKDGKEYPLIRVDYNEEWPRIEKVRRKVDDGAQYIGPFSHGGHLYTSLRVLEKVFPLIRCTRHEFKNAKRPCNYFHMGMCLGPCTLPIDREDYVKMIQRSVSVLKGNHSEVSANLRDDMLRASDLQQFEKAALLRDQITALAQVNNRQTVVLDEPIDVDTVAYIASVDGDVVISMLFLRHGKLIGHENYSFSCPFSTVYESIESFLVQYYTYKEIPQELILPEDFANPDTLQKSLDILRRENQKEKKHGSFQVILPKRGPKAKLIDLAMKNALFFQSDKAKSSESRRRDLEQLKADLNLPVFPSRIECIDISNMSGQSVVGAVSCFVDARPAKKFYRKYKIKTLSEGEQNDFASVYEVTLRRLRHAVEEDDFPDLLVIDGGKAQLAKALEAREHLKLAQPFIVSLAKARSRFSSVEVSPRSTEQSAALLKSFERVFIPGLSDPIVLSDGSPTFRILTQVRDEAHRFVIAYHRQKRSEKSFKSDFDELIGIGPVLRKRLQLAFGTLERAFKATDSELLSVKGLRMIHVQAIRASVDEKSKVS